MTTEMRQDRIATAGVGNARLASLIVPAYLAGSALLLAGAALNPIPALVLLSGLSSGFLCMAGLLAVPAASPTDGLPTPSVLGRARAWRMAGVVVAALFLGVLGPGVAL